MFARAALYFEEVAKRGSIRRAAERLHIAPSAVDRQIIQLEEQFGLPLFERTPKGLRLTAAGEILLDAVRRWGRDLHRVKAQILDLQGLRRGEVSVALVEGATEFFTKNLQEFRDLYPGIAYSLRVAGSNGVSDLVISGECDIGLTFNPPISPALRIEGTLIYQLGGIVTPDHPLAAHAEVTMEDCAAYPLIIPDESISLRSVLNQAWAQTVGGSLPYFSAASSIGMIKSLVKRGMGVGMLTALDAFDEINAGELVFLPLAPAKIPLSVLSIMSASGRTLSVPASLLLQHISVAMVADTTPAA